MARIEGRNSVYEALKGKRKIHRIFIQNNISGDNIEKIKKLAEAKNISINRISKYKLDETALSHSHQGVIAEADPLPEYTLGDLSAEIKEKDSDPLVVILDEIKDPHNFGAIIRTAYAAGADAVIYQERRAAGITPVVLKSSAGSAEHIPLIQVTNINYTIKDLKEEGFWIAGADVGADQLHYDADLKGSLGIVIGSEGSGLRRLVKENCDFLIKIPMFSQLGSLNASVAAGIILYEAVRQRLKR
ncbi:MULTISPECIES: 23S rRNA (guanosine(2251)-2'-O)-methyltransferase RlmB [unclassified Halanaerobium]|uniref:23S rRNA (guanosine(2251)-2'-O)-methyltransferase RlmB n=1 Tax=unclassified Halanaerobium TaxID=2641197 RepID=UPI000DF153EF|nr:MULTISPECIES: 23S rRNA (guanosine(2251)-2'-O)-methyltransferase RlmB [unclassified Halanaerobium]RCW41260.1 23S rRNA (guanosine2251-2'-O)-methyltransferase [Halanaerobium sp. MA284_MarDTE_T2]RCW79669.1 23S rRNA (guanosine2251-2'-O)-methyltransferase [Halanaerobium sp. DL-01]